LRHRKIAKQLKAQGITTIRFWEHQLSQNVNRCILKISSLLGS
jgi:very-short-patch-repair endonuclease